MILWNEKNVKVEAKHVGKEVNPVLRRSEVFCKGRRQLKVKTKVTRGRGIHNEPFPKWNRVPFGDVYLWDICFNLLRSTRSEGNLSADEGRICLTA